MAQRRVELRGRDYRELGPLALVALPGAGALALSRGAEPKAYAHVDPNEDGALLVANDGGLLAAVVDGYNGAAASERALDAVAAAAAELIAAGGRDFAERARRLALDVAGTLREVAPSHTCLLLAARRGAALHFASFGDSTLFRASSNAAASPATPHVLGPRLKPRALGPEAPWHGAFTLAPGERVALVTDGVTNFAPEPERLGALLRAQNDAASGARAIARAALDGGAGDNVAVAVLEGPPA
jgi:serine/threonine protein phosphatase PrpC